MDELEAKIVSLVNFAREKDIEEIVLERDGTKIAFRRQTTINKEAIAGEISQQQPPQTTTVEKPGKETINSPMVGRFRRAVEEKHPPLVVEGDTISPGQRLGVVEAMRIPKDIISQLHGIIIKILVEDGSPVEYGQPLFEVELMEQTG